jgi:hypothetical protein
MANTGNANRQMPNTGGWQDRHDTAWKMQRPDCHLRVIEGNAPFLAEQSVVAMLKGWQTYAAAHLVQHGSKISEDYFLGPQWLAIGKGLRTLLNGETGRLDGGTVDGFILDTTKEAGFDENDI